MRLTLIEHPAKLPSPPEGRVVVADIAFAYGQGYESATRPFIEGLGERLVAWVDHHDHEAWTSYAADARFVLVGKHAAPACPQLITQELIRRLGSFDHVVAHADFDGCMTAVKLMRGGEPPYAEADEDGRAIDAPGRGFVCSARGLRIARAMDQMRERGSTEYLDLLERTVRALVAGEESPEFTEEIDRLASARKGHEDAIAAGAEAATSPHPGILVLRFEAPPSSADKKLFLRALQERARVAVVVEPGWVTAATYDSQLDLARIEGVKGQAGYVFQDAAFDSFLPRLVAALGE